MKKNRINIFLLSLGLLFSCNYTKSELINSINKNHKLITEKCHKKNGTAENYYNYKTIKKGSYSYDYYYDLNTVKIVQIYTGIAIDTYEGINDKISISRSEYITISAESGITTTYSTNESVAVAGAKVSFELFCEASIGMSISTTYTETITNSYSHNDEDGYGTYYLYMDSIIATYKIVTSYRGRVLSACVMRNICDSRNDKFELLKKQPKITAPLLSVC